MIVIVVMAAVNVIENKFFGKFRNIFPLFNNFTVRMVIWYLSIRFLLELSPVLAASISLGIELIISLFFPNNDDSPQKKQMTEFEMKPFPFVPQGISYHLTDPDSSMDLNFFDEGEVIRFD